LTTDDHELVTVRRQRRSVSMQLQIFVTVDDRDRHGLGGRRVVLWGATTPTKVGVGVQQFTAASTRHRTTLLSIPSITKC